MKVLELIINALDDFTGVDAVALVEEPAIQADFFAFNDKQIQDSIMFGLIKNAMKDLFVTRRPGESKEDYISRCIPVLEKEGYPKDQAAAICYSTFDLVDEGELDIHGYVTRHFDICPGAVSLYEAILRGDHGTIDQNLVIRAAKLQDALFYLEKTVLEKGTATEEDVISAQNLADEIYVLADMMNLREQHSYVDGHIAKIKEVAAQQFESYTDYPKQATENAKIALRYAEENGWGSCGTPVGKARANQLAKGEAISEDTVARMAAFARHRRNGQKELGDGCGRLMWLAWGGDAGVDWAIRKMDKIREERNLTSKFNFALQEDQQMVVGPLMIPDKLILRVDENGDPYYVYFSKETIKQVGEKLMKNEHMNRLNLENNPDKPVEGYMVSTWIVEDQQKDKQQIYGFNHPVGTLMGQYKIEDMDAWQKVKEGQVKGFSVEGFFNDRFVQASK